MGNAHLPNGEMLDYKEYIANHPHWQTVRRERFKFDSGKCVVCHADVGFCYETHHLHYMHLGNEHMTDVITMCPKCHARFHESWVKNEYWKGRAAGHWQIYDINHTARLCATIYKEDKFISGNIDGPNLCNQDIDKQYIDSYMIEYQILDPVLIDPNDIQLYVRNKRYELFFEYEKKGCTVEQFLDLYYGEKIRGKNPIRQEAGKKNGPFDHIPEKMHKFYSENPNINKLILEAKKYEQT